MSLWSLPISLLFFSSRMLLKSTKEKTAVFACLCIIVHVHGYLLHCNREILQKKRKRNLVKRCFSGTVLVMWVVGLPRQKMMFETIESQKKWKCNQGMGVTLIVGQRSSCSLLTQDRAFPDITCVCDFNTSPWQSIGLQDVRAIKQACVRVNEAFHQDIKFEMKTKTVHKVNHRN